MKLAGENFSVTPLAPFGERWTPERGPVAVDGWVNTDIHAVVEAMKRAKLVVMDSTQVSPDWRYVEDRSESQIPQVAHSGFSNPIAVQMLSAEGLAGDTSYARNADLVEAARCHVGILRAAHVAASPETRQRFGLDITLEQYTRPGEEYYSYSPLEPLSRMRDALYGNVQQLTGHMWVAGQDLRAVSTESLELLTVYRLLRDFYVAIARDTAKFTQRWDERPQSTVFNYQDEGERFTAPENLVYHFSDPDGGEGRAPLRCNAILGDFFDRDGKYQLFTDAVRHAW